MYSNVPYSTVQYKYGTVAERISLVQPGPQSPVIPTAMVLCRPLLYEYEYRSYLPGGEVLVLVLRYCTVVAAILVLVLLIH